MSLLYPLMALGVFAVGVPLWLHLRRRDEDNLVEFSTLRFLDEQPIARARPLWPRNWPLLLLRMAALVLLVAAFTWPYVEGEEAVGVEESRVYILDNTLSHQVDGAFEAARDQVVSALAENDVRTQIGVVELSTTAGVVARFGDNPAVAADAVRALQPSSVRGSFIDAFRSAAEMLQTSLGEKQRIVLLSDNQSNQWTLEHQSPPFLGAGVEVELPRPAEMKPSNFSLSGPRARRFFRDGRHWIEAGVVLTRQNRQENTAVVFRDRGREVSRQEIESVTNTDTAPNTDNEEVRSSAAVLAQWEVDSSDWVLGEVVLEDNDDSLAGDDRVFFSLPPLRAGRIELLANSLFLRRALDPEVMSGRWEVQFADQDQMMDRHQADAPGVLCVESHALSSSLVRETIREDLSEGRGVLLMVDGATPVIAGFLRDLGIDFESPSEASTEPATFRFVYAEHPVFEPFRSTDLGNLAEVQFVNYRRLKMRDAIPLAFSASGDPLVFEVASGAGRMLVLAFAFDRQDTNWPIHPTFIPFLDKAFDYLRGQTLSAADYQSGESVSWSLPPGKSAQQVTVSMLDPATGERSPQNPPPIRVDLRDRQARFQLPPQPGHYAIQLGEPDSIKETGSIIETDSFTDQRWVADVLDVNPPPLESELSYEAEPAPIAAWTREENRGRETEAAVNSGMKLTTLEAFQQPYWWFLILAAVAAFVAETMMTAVSTTE